MSRFWLTLTISAIALAGCATTGTSQMDFPDTTPPEARLFGDFLVGTYANEINAADIRSKYYSKAFSQASDNVQLGRRALNFAIVAGDLDTAKDIAEDLEELDNTDSLMRAFLGARAFAKGRNEAAEKYFETSTADYTIQRLLNLLRGWNAADMGDEGKARSIFATIGGGGYFDMLGEWQTANLEASNGDIESAKELYAKVEEASLAPIETALSKSRALSVAGDIDGALAYLEEFAEENGPFENGPIPFYKKTLQSGEPITETLTPQQETARVLTEAAFGFFVRNRANDAAELYLRFALMLDPDHHKATLWLGSLVENGGRQEDAMALYKSIPLDSPYIVPAKLSQANIYFANEEDDKALAVLEAANESHTSFTTRESLGRARMIRENYEEALPIYDALVNSMSEADLMANPEPLYFRGICHERLKDWDKAVADFKKVLEIDPDNADVLNYLGYTWVDRNENLEEAFDMIRRAVELEPDSGAITDSLGWAHYKLGQYEEAKIQLEKAVELSPSSATIIDHLGDVYWKLGRFREAGYQWKRALEFDPTDEERANIELKLEGGLEAVDAMP